MSLLPRVDEPRRVVPRWRDGATAVLTGEISALPRRDPLDVTAEADAELARHVADWERTPTVGHAADLVAAAIVLDRPRSALGAAEFLLRSGDASGPIAADLARSILLAVEKGHLLEPQREAEIASSRALESLPKSVRAHVGARIHLLRRRLHDDPRNVIAWLDLARYYTRLGEAEQANRAVRIAVALAPDHRFVLRSASRHYIHAGDADHAHALLRRSPATPTDPWLVAAEIAISMVAGRGPRYVKAAQSILASGRFAPFQTTELASALATLEAVGGASKRARRLFTQALRDPTENTVAQVQWAARNLRYLIEVPASVWRVPRIFEARASTAFWSGEWEDALKAAWDWLDDEPFSGRPVELGTTAAVVGLGQFQQGVQLAELGVLANPSDARLRNNFVFALAAAGQSQRAAVELEVAARLTQPTASAEDQVVLRANAGLVGFASGDVAFGNAGYQAAVNEARRAGNAGLEAAALHFWAAAALRAERHQALQAPDPRSIAAAAQIFAGSEPPAAAELVARAEETAHTAPPGFNLQPARLWLATAQREVEAQRAGRETKTSDTPPPARLKPDGLDTPTSE